MPVYHPRLGWQRVGVQSLPVELLYNILEDLDRGTVRSCMFVCRKWHPVSERLLCKTAIVSSKASFDAFVRALKAKSRADFADHVKELHIRGKVNYSSSTPTDWIVEVPARLVGLLQNVRSLTFEHIEGVSFPEGTSFWSMLERCFGQVTELRFKACHFATAQDVFYLMFSFPQVTALSLWHVSWKKSGESRKSLPGRRNYMPLERLELAYLQGDAEWAEVFFWVQSLQTVREVVLIDVPPRAQAYAGRYLYYLFNSIESLSFAPVIVHNRDLNYLHDFTKSLSGHTRLETLRLQIVSVAEPGMFWVHRVLDAVAELPIRRVALDFTLDPANAKRLTSSWEQANNALSMNWVNTLEEVTLTHHPVGNFLRDDVVTQVLRSRLPGLVKRGLLKVNIGERYLDL